MSADEMVPRAAAENWRMPDLRIRTLGQFCVSVDGRVLQEAAIGFDFSFSWSGPAVLHRARIAALAGDRDAEALLRDALGALESGVSRLPVAADQWFSRLAEAAGTAPDSQIAPRARELESLLRAKRQAAIESVQARE
jgi:hypothetical protein